MKYILANGTFDVLHTGHIALLNYAKSLGDYLLVALDTDERIQDAKGYDRPVNNEHIRGTIMQNLKAVDEVTFFGSDEELIDIIKNYSPDIRVIGSDWKGKTVVGEEFCKEIVYFDRVNDESTTKTLDQYAERRSLVKEWKEYDFL
jgi:D-beta-D-heptose 7-phosphate kinase/D-beta-D-heptose 1-phosphate adenosyltransferase